MVERIIGRNCPFCNVENPIYAIRTDNVVIRNNYTYNVRDVVNAVLEYPESGTPSPMSQARAFK